MGFNSGFKGLIFLDPCIVARISGVPNQPGQRPVTTCVHKPEAANAVWSSWWWAVCPWKHVEPSINFGIINPITRLHLVGYFYWFTASDICLSERIFSDTYNKAYIYPPERYYLYFKFKEIHSIIYNEGRLHHHENVEAIQLLDNTGIVRRLQRKKNFWASLSDSVKAETVLVCQCKSRGSTSVSVNEKQRQC